MTITGDLVTMAIAAATPDETDRVYEFGSVPPKPVYPYRVVGYAPGAPVVRTQDAQGDPLRRFTVQHFSRTSAGLEDVTSASLNAFDGKPIYGDVCELEVGGATPPSRDADDRGVLSTTHVYRF